MCIEGPYDVTFSLESKYFPIQEKDIIKENFSLFRKIAKLKMNYKSILLKETVNNSSLICV